MRRGFWCCVRRARCQSLDLQSFFGRTGSRTMGFDVGAIDGDRAAQMTGRGQGIEHVLPDAPS